MLDTDQQASGTATDSRTRHENEQPPAPAETKEHNESEKPKKIAVLGGGCAALAAVFAITESPEYEPGNPEITVYQSGWRLGGKGASGRNAQHGQRIEEHGLHVWSGFYENAFWLMRKCYAELRRPSTHPLATAFAAFRPRHYVSLGQNDGNTEANEHPARAKWRFWSGYLPHDAGRPGDAIADDCRASQVSRPDAPLPGAECAKRKKKLSYRPIGRVRTPWEYMAELIPWAIRYLQTTSVGTNEVLRKEVDRRDALLDLFLCGLSIKKQWLQRVKNLVLGIWLLVVLAAFRRANRYHDRVIGWMDEGEQHGPVRTWFRTKCKPFNAQAGCFRRLALVLAPLRWWSGRRLHRLHEQLEARRKGANAMQGNAKDQELQQLERNFTFFTLTNLALAMMIGMIRDGVLGKGFSAIDHCDLRMWLKQHGAHHAGLSSATVMSAYSYVFAFEHGRYDCPQLAAGVALRLMFRLLLASRGAVFWEMTAGMGDVVFAPLYEVLKERGVKFRFFHRVDSLESDDGREIDTIRIGRQARLKADGPDARYQPFVTVKGLKCWPSQPLYDQLVEGEQMSAFFQDKPCNLESAYTEWPDCEEIVLKKKEDFDRVILGISVGALRFVCRHLLEGKYAERPLAKAATKLGTTRTAGVQLWLSRSTEDLGWAEPPPIITSYEGPLDTWADMSSLLEREDWPEGDCPRAIAYFCGVHPDDEDEIPGLRDPAEHPQREAEACKACKEHAKAWLAQNVAALWPSAVRPLAAPAAAQGLPASAGDTAAVEWDPQVLFRRSPPPGIRAPQASDDDFYDCQWYVANVDPSSRYVLSLPETTQYRPAAGDSGFDNLVLAGDWLRTGLNYGCVESAVMGGLQAARAICGFPDKIYGEHDLPGNYPLDRRKQNDESKQKQAGHQRVVHDAAERKSSRAGVAV